MQQSPTASESKPGGMGVFKYELLLLLMSIIWGSAFVAQQIGMQKGLGPMTFNGLRFTLGCLSLIPVRIACLQFAICAVLSALSGLLFEHCTIHQIKAVSGAVAYAGLMSVGIAFTLQVVCQKHCPPAPAAIIMSLEAVFAALVGYPTAPSQPPYRHVHLIHSPSHHSSSRKTQTTCP